MKDKQLEEIRKTHRAADHWMNVCCVRVLSNQCFSCSFNSVAFAKLLVLKLVETISTSYLLYWILSVSERIHNALHGLPDLTSRRHDCCH